MKTFEWANADSFTDASERLSEAGAFAIGGGTDLLGALKDEILPEYPKTLVNLKTIPGYGDIAETADGVTIGAGATLQAVAGLSGYPALAQAALSVASPLIRARATIGGNICQDTRCWYYRYPDSIGGKLVCLRKGGETCHAIRGENRYHSVCGGAAVHTPACGQGCPAGTDVPGYADALQRGDLAAAANLLMQYNPMPMLTSRVCPHPCRDRCNQRLYGDSVNIPAMERSLGDYILEHMGDFYAPPLKESGKTAAVVGAGPGGLAHAYYLRKAGHAVTVYDKLPKAGGVLRYGIPHYRLPKTLIDAFVNGLAEMGVTFKQGIEIGKDLTVKQLRAANDTVYIGTGAWKQPVLGIEGEALTVFGLDFLTEVNAYLKKSIGGRVLVCGGGNVAMDVALTAARLGAESVTLACLEREADMPAAREEVERAKEEGVALKNGWGLRHVVTDAGGAVKALAVKRCLSVTNAEGRFAPVYDEDDTAEIAADVIILATGQRVDLGFLGEAFQKQIVSARGLIEADAQTFQTNAPGVYAGGDAVTGPDIAIRAIAAGREAARAVCAEIGGQQGVPERTANPRFDRGAVCEQTARTWTERPLGDRNLTDEDAAGLSEGDAKAEAARCMRCACYAVNPSDVAPALVLYAATVVTNRRELPAAAFFAGMAAPGFLDAGEVVERVFIPKQTTSARYDKNRVRDAIDFATVSLASRVVVENGVCKSAELVLGGVGASPVAAEEAAAYLTGKPANDDTAKEAAKLFTSRLCFMAGNEHKAAIVTDLITRAVTAQS